MKKSLAFLSTVAFTTILIGCNDNDESIQHDSNIDFTQPIGYYNQGETADQVDPRADTMPGYENDEGHPVRDYLNGDSYPEYMKEQYDLTPPNYGPEFDEKTSNAISKKLSELPNVLSAQVVVNDDLILVAVEEDMYSHARVNPNRDLAQIVRDTVEEMNLNRQVRVYTDKQYWDRIQNLRSRHKPSDGISHYEDDVEGFLDGFDNTLETIFE